MPSRSSRRLKLKRLPRGINPNDHADSGDPDDTSHAQNPPTAAAAALDQEAYSSVDAGGAASGHGEIVHGQEALHHEEDHVTIRSSASAEAALAFEPPQNLDITRSDREETPQRAIQIQIRNKCPEAADPNSPNARSSMQSLDDLADAAASPAYRQLQPSPIRTVFAPPIVTKSTRRETFASSFDTKPRSRKKKSESGRLLLHPASSSSGDEDSHMKDLFSPPPSSSLRTRPRPRQQQQHHHPMNDLTATVTHSTSLDETPREGSHHHHAHHEHAFESPPTIYTPHTVEGGRMAVSTTQKRQYQGRVVHVPRGEREPGHEHAGEEEASEGSGDSEAAQIKSMESAPARLPVSRRVTKLALAGILNLPFSVS